MENIIDINGLRRALEYVKNNFPEYSIVDSNDNEFPMRKYLKFFNSSITDLQFENTTLINIRGGGGGQGYFNVFNIIGDEETTEYVFVHDFNTRNILYSIYNKTTGAETVFNVIRTNDVELKIVINAPLGIGNDYILVLFAVDGSRKIPVNDVNNLEATVGNKSVMLKWDDPENVEEAEEIIATWKGTRVMRKIGAFPIDEDDGILVIDNQEKNKYSTDGFIDNGLTEDTEYFYQLFPYTEEYVFNRNETNRITATPILIFPEPVTNLQTVTGNKSISVKYTNPTGEFSGVRLVYKTGDFPTNINDGTVIINYTSGTSINNLTEDTQYFFRLFSFNKYDNFNIDESQQIQETAVLIIPNKVTNVNSTSGDGQVSITYTSPASNFTKVKLVYKSGSFPSNINDGTVVDNYISGSAITGLTNDTEYFFRLFSFNEYENYNDDETQQITGTPNKPPYKVWGVRIDTTNSNPDTSSVYTDDCLIAPPTDFGERPCVLKDGVVQYYLNPNDFTKKEDGSAAVITGNDGEVMIEIPKLAYLIRYSGNYLDVKVTTHPNAKQLDSGFCYYGHTRDTEGDLSKIYIGAYLGQTVSSKLRSISGVQPTGSVTIGSFRTQAQANGTGYDQISFYPLTLLQCMYLVKYRNLNSQTALGRGWVDSPTGYADTGGTNTKGMYYGETTGKLQMKFAGLEDFWGNKLQWIDGYVTNANREVLVGFKSFNDAGTGYSNKGNSAAANLANYMSKAIGDNDCGFIVKEASGSATTYYCDYGYRYASCVPCFGGHRASADGAGAFYLRAINAASDSNAIIGARLMFRPTS